jgi:hypothetical protein
MLFGHLGDIASTFGAAKGARICVIVIISIIYALTRGSSTGSPFGTLPKSLAQFICLGGEILRKQKNDKWMLYWRTVQPTLIVGTTR